MKVTVYYLFLYQSHFSEDPVRAGIVYEAADYKFSSAIVYRGKDWESLLEIDMLEW